MSSKRSLDATGLPSDESQRKVRIITPTISRALEMSSSRGQSPNNFDGTVQTSHQTLTQPSLQSILDPIPTSATSPDCADNIQPFDPMQFAKRTPIPITREGMRKPKGSSPPSNQGNQSTKARMKNAISKIYRYRRIKKDQVRLLVIKPGAPTDPLNATLLTLNDSQLESDEYSFAALSYNWGDGDADVSMVIQDTIQSQSIKSLSELADGAMTQAGLHAKKMFIRPNLDEALKQLRRASESSFLYIWVDALCIDQSDDDEKQEQVMKMAHIYRNAKNVCIWLGTDEPGNGVSDVAMKFIPDAIEPDNYTRLVNEPEYASQWASLFELLRWSWFSRRWVIQELALAKHATVHCGAHTIHWNDFEDAIAIFCRAFYTLKAKLKEHFKSKHPQRRNKYLDSAFEIDQFGAKLLVEVTSELFRREADGSYESTMGLETLVCGLSNFDTSDPRDTINAFLNICKELKPLNENEPYPVPKPDYSKNLFQIYRDFVQWAVGTSRSLDIICRYWALSERPARGITSSQRVELPTWILPVDDGAFGRGEEVYHGRKAGDSLVGLPGLSQYNASGVGHRKKYPDVQFPQDPQRHGLSSETEGRPQSLSLDNAILPNTTLIVAGLEIGTVSFCNQPFADGVIPRDCLEKLGWCFNWGATEVEDVPDQLWRTLVADRGPNGQPKAKTYRRACQFCLVNLTRNGHMNIKEVLREEEDGHYTKDYLERVLAVTWDRSFIEGSPLGPKNTDVPEKKLVGLGPSKSKTGDVIAILYGCSVPVILRPVPDTQDYEFIGEAYIHGKMDGEAIGEQFEERKFRLI